MTRHSRPILTPEEYLALERAAETKSEYLDGEMIPMPGAGLNHNRITVNITVSLASQVHRQPADRPCQVLANDMRVLISATGSYTYPDVIVVMGEPILADEHFDNLLNPAVLVEVLSPSTERFDRGRKLVRYRTIPSLREVLLVSQDRPRIEHQCRREDGSGWDHSVAEGLTSEVELPCIGCRLTLADVYARVRFDQKPSATGGR
jgi:Uma2 family endonuclease